MMNKIPFVLILLVILISVWKCSENKPDLGKYYENSFSDTITTVMITDTVKLIIEQFGISNQVKEYIPHNIMVNNSLVDTLKLVLNVKFGSYSPDPDPYINISSYEDSLYIWYASRKKPGSDMLSKTNSITSPNELQISPKTEFYNIENINIIKSSKKIIDFESRLFQ